MPELDAQFSFDIPSVDPALRGLLMGGDAYSMSQDWWEDRRLFDTALDMTGVVKPNVLIVPTAVAKSAASHERIVGGLTDYYTQRGADPSVLHPYMYRSAGDEPGALRGMAINPSKVPSQAELSEKIEAADLIFVAGGDTNRMLNQVWRPFGFDTKLLDAMRNGKVITGTSAGTIAWFDGGHTAGDSIVRRTAAGGLQYRYVKALGAISNTVVCPHFEATPKLHRSRETSFNDMMYRRRALGELGLGMTAKVALQINPGGQLAVIRGTGKGPAHITALHYRQAARKSRRTVTAHDGQFSLTDLVA
ncbi:MAG: hypothetical protein JWN38_843 [Candidatus Saccharibacteria bacterium]|nr:hypothetical protein [Candidatus Saccharibacteria bacterium]